MHFSEWEIEQALMVFGGSILSDEDLEAAFDAIQSKAVEVDRIRAIPAFRRVCLDE